MTIAQLNPTPTIPDVDEQYALYAEIFAGINSLAAQRHLMTAAEFRTVYHDSRILKFYLHDETGALAGMSVLTQDLDAWPLISPPYFARRWPEHYARQAIWYVGFVGVTPHRPHGFRELVSRMYAHVISNSGIVVVDYCTYNMTRRRLATITHKLLSGLNPDAGMELADSQATVVYHFDQAYAGA